MVIWNFNDLRNGLHEMIPMDIFKGIFCKNRKKDDN
jgi:hypothetical protein